MSDDLIRRSDAIASLGEEPYVWTDDDEFAQGERSQWIDDVSAIKAVPSADRPQEWIPCSDRLPEDSGDYLVCLSDGFLEDYSEFGEVSIMPYDADCEAFGWWIERYDPISLGYLDSDFNEVEVLAWMPLPKPLKGAGDYERAAEQTERDALYESTYNSEDGSM